MYISCSSTYSSDGHQGTRHSSGGVYCILISTLSLSCFVHILQREAEYRLFRQNMGRHTNRTPQDTPLERATADRQSIVTKANNVLSFPSNIFSLSAIGRRDGVSRRGLSKKKRHTSGRREAFRSVLLGRERSRRRYRSRISCEKQKRAAFSFYSTSTWAQGHANLAFYHCYHTYSWEIGMRDWTPPLMPRTMRGHQQQHNSFS